MTPEQIEDLIRRARRIPPPLPPARIAQPSRRGKHTADSLDDQMIRSLLETECDAMIKRICRVALQSAYASTRRRMRSRLATIINFRLEPPR